MLSFFKKKKKSIPERTIDDLKRITKILFIDDLTFNLVDSLKEKDGWQNVQKIKDVDSLSQTEVREAHIIFVDVQGVGKKLGFEDEGLGLISALRNSYPAKKIIMYSAESKGRIDGLHPSGNIVDYRLRKTATRYEFESTIERFAKESFCLDNCIMHIKDVFLRELGITKNDEEIRRIVEILYNKGTYNDPQKIASAFNLSNIGSIASIIQLLLMS